MIHIPEGNYVSKFEAAEMLGLQPPTIQYYINRGELETIHIPRLGHILLLEVVEKFQPKPTGRPRKTE